MDTIDLDELTFENMPPKGILIDDRTGNPYGVNPRAKMFDKLDNGGKRKSRKGGKRKSKRNRKSRKH